MTIPALRERADDVPLLLDYYLDLYCAQHSVERPQVSTAAMESLMNYRWPGNIRELRNVVERLALKSVGSLVRPTDLPAEVSSRPVAVRVPATPGATAAAPSAQSSQVDQMLLNMLQNGEPFWSAVYPAFMSRDLTRDDLRRIIEVGLERTNGSYRLLVQLYNMPNEDYKRFLGFLRKHNCHLPFQRFRTIPSRSHLSHANHLARGSMVAVG